MYQRRCKIVPISIRGSVCIDLCDGRRVLALVFHTEVAVQSVVKQLEQLLEERDEKSIDVNDLRRTITQRFTLPFLRYNIDISITMDRP